MKNIGKFILNFILILSFTSFAEAPLVYAANPALDTNSSVPSINKLDNAIVLFVGSPEALVNNKEVQVDPSNSEVTPVIVNERTLVPVRFISSSFGADVGWDAASQTVTVKLGDKTASMVIGSDRMAVGSSEVILDTETQIINDKTFIPLRQLTYALGKKVFYDRGLIIISDKEELYNASLDKGAIDEIIARVNNLPIVGSLDTLKEILKKSQDSNPNIMTIQKEKAYTVNSNDMKTAAVAPAVPEAQGRALEQSAGSTGNDFSATNVQVQGVDEGDMVKTDGEYIYQANKQRVVVTKAYPADNMEIAGTITFEDKNFTPQDLYLDGQNLVVIGMTNNYVPMLAEPKLKVGVIMPPIRNSSTSLKAIVYDITDKRNIKQIREVEIEGNYIDSRKIGSSLYLIANRYMNYYYIDSGEVNLTPSFRDTAVKDEFINIDYPDIRYFPGMVESNYMIIASIDLNKPTQKANIETYLGVGQSIYASAQNLYVSVNKFTNNTVRPNSLIRIMPNSENNTLIYKFSLNDGMITYLCRAEVPGRIQNQFSMDENNKSFRIATTRDNIFDGTNYTSQNNLYVLDELLNVTGKIENIAPGERIYSTRFIGDRGYMVTFRTVDPLFVIDLKEPSAPKILGQLKIPGYSEYLQPYDENHIIGFGKDAVELPQKDWGGKDTGKTTAFYMGLKIALFDVTDVNNPVEMFKENIGDRGTDSELLRDHKALLFSKSKNLLAFPVTLMQISNKNPETSSDNGMPGYGQFTFQGEYVYNLDLVNGFKLKGRITHLSDEDYLKAGTYGYDNDKNVERALYINNTLYTLSNGVIKANDLSDLKEIKALNIP